MQPRTAMHGTWIVSLSIAAFSVAAGAQGGAPALLADVERGKPSRRGASAHDFAEMQGVLYYSAWDVQHGFELWRTDGSAEGTYLLADVQPGPVGSMPRHLTALGGTLFFVANDGTSGFGLWKSDGTAAGTRLVKGVAGGFRHPRQLTALGSLLLLTAGALHEPRLWRSDGTPAGTEMVRELWETGETAAFAQPRLPGAIVGSDAYFMTRANGHRALWRSDGTAGGTSRVWMSPVPPVQAEPWMQYDIYASAGDYLLFRGQDASGDGLWRSDGTPAGTYALASAPAGELLVPDFFTRIGTTVVFAARTNAGYSYGLSELWRSDGTPAGTQPILSLGPFDPCRQIVAAGGRAFIATDSALLASDGSSAGTQWLAALNNAALAGTGERVFFASGWPFGADGKVGVVDATTGQVTVVGGGFIGAGVGWFRRSSADAGVAPLAVRTPATLGDSAYLSANHSMLGVPPSGSRYDPLWLTDGTTVHPVPIAAPPLRHTRGSWPAQFAGDAGAAYFATTLGLEPDTAGQALRLLKHDPVAGTTSVVASWPASTFTCNGWWADCPALFHLTALDKRVFFVLERSPWGPFELWTSDGSTDGTLVLHTTYERPRSGLGVAGSRVVFHDAQDGRLWASDGTKDGTLPIGAPAGPAGTADLQFTPVGDVLFFATSGAAGALYRTDGTPGSVQIVKQAAAAELTGVDGTLFFTSHGELWKSDGSAAGTLRVSATRHAARLTAVGAHVFFSAWDGARGTELWVSDGSAAGTRLVADLRGGPGSSDPDGLTAEGGRLFFTAYDDVRGRELWVTDGTREGTWPLTGAQPGPASSLGVGAQLAAGGGRVYFPAYAAATGLEPWSSDGTPQGTALLADVAPGAASSNPRELAVIGSRLYFSADDGVHGQEPWSLALPAAGKDE